MDAGLGIGPLHRRPDLARRGVIDGIEPLRAVQQQAGNARVGVVGRDAQGGKVGHGGLRGGLGRSLGRQKESRCRREGKSVGGRRLGALQNRKYR